MNAATEIVYGSPPIDKHIGKDESWRCQSVRAHLEAIRKVIAYGDGEFTPEAREKIANDLGFVIALISPLCPQGVTA